MRHPHDRRHPLRSSQVGLSLIGLLVIGALVAFLVVVALRVTPTVTEYFEIKSAVQRAAKAGGGPVDVRAAFEKYKAAGYITTLSGKDLEVTKDANNRLKVSFAYEKRIPLGGPVYLLIEYAGSAQGATE